MWFEKPRGPIRSSMSKHQAAILVVLAAVRFKKASKADSFVDVRCISHGDTGFLARREFGYPTTAIRVRFGLGRLAFGRRCACWIEWLRSVKFADVLRVDLEARPAAAAFAARASLRRRLLR